MYVFFISTLCANSLRSIYVHMCVCIYIHTYVKCMYVYVCIYKYLVREFPVQQQRCNKLAQPSSNAHTYVCVCVCMYVHVSMHPCMYVCVCVYICVYVCMYATIS